MMQQPEVTPSPDWARFQGVLISCLQKLVELYRDAIQEDPGDYDWSVLVKNAALGQFNEEIPHKSCLNASSNAWWGNTFGERSVIVLVGLVRHFSGRHSLRLCSYDGVTS